MNPKLYFDYNASTPMKPSVRKAVINAMETHYGIAAASHTPGRRAHDAVELARAKVARLINAPPEHVIFTSSATESNNLILKGAQADRILISDIEHSSVFRVVPQAERIAVTPEGTVDLDALEDKLKENAGQTLVSVMWVNNETGVIQPMKEISAMCQKYGAWLHSDAVQATGRIPVDVKAPHIDLLSLSGHKIGGPQGIGAAVIPSKIPVKSLMQGGSHEGGYRPGTRNLLGIVGFGAAAKLAKCELENVGALTRLRDRFEAEAARIAPEAVFFGRDAPRVGTTSLLSLPGIPGPTQAQYLDRAGIATNSGSTCSAGVSGKAMNTLIAMGVDEETASSILRISLGWRTDQESIDNLLEVWETMYHEMRDKIVTRKPGQQPKRHEQPRLS